MVGPPKPGQLRSFRAGLRPNNICPMDCITFTENGKPWMLDGKMLRGAQGIQITLRDA
jgi:hypothetical protein